MAVDTTVPNRQGAFSGTIHEEIVENGEESLETSVERHLDDEIEGEWS